MNEKQKKKNMKEIILDILRLQNGIKAVDLALDTMSRVNPVRFCTEEYHKTIDELVSSGEIIEIEYINPEMPYRVKSIYFSKGTFLLRGLNDTRALARESIGDEKVSLNKKERVS